MPISVVLFFFTNINSKVPKLKKKVFLGILENGFGFQYSFIFFVFDPIDNYLQFILIPNFTPFDSLEHYKENYIGNLKKNNVCGRKKFQRSKEAKREKYF